MLWTKCIIHTTTALEEDVAYRLSLLGIDAVEIEDFSEISNELQGGTFAELQPDRPADDGTARVIFYLDEEADVGAVLSDVRAALGELRVRGDSAFAQTSGDGNPEGNGSAADFVIDIETTQDEDWANNWKEYFHAFTVDDILIKPSWESLEESLAAGIAEGTAVSHDEVVLADGSVLTVVEIDPGLSFGTGAHESTQLVIKQMKNYLAADLPDFRVLDVGCGSGILSVIALKKGVSHIVGTDIDEDCIASTYENMKKNGFAETCGDFYVGDLATDADLQNVVGKENYDLIFANILADIIIGMADALYAAAKEGGVLISSGIIDFKESEVKSALEKAGFSIIETTAMGEWRSVTARRGGKAEQTKRNAVSADLAGGQAAKGGKK